MNSVERDRLREVMAGMAAGDMAMLVAFVSEFGTPLRGVVRSIVFSFGRRDVLDDPGELTSLVTTVALEIFDRADAWDPEGAVPWHWAERAIRSSIARQVGHALADVAIEDLCDVSQGPIQQSLQGLDGDARRVLKRLSATEPERGCGGTPSVVSPTTATATCTSSSSSNRCSATGRPPRRWAPCSTCNPTTSARSCGEYVPS